jgi:hypothetical protein
VKTTKTYKQCMLTRGNQTDVVWLPTVFAFVGKNLQIRPTPTADFEPGWVVTEVYPTIWNQDDADNARGNHKRFDDVLGG